MSVKLIHGNCLWRLQYLDDASIDSLVTDPPAGIAFMGKSWDSDKGGRKQWITWMSDVMRECHRVMKPGAHGLVWAIPRTSHWTATALEDAGFEVRDVVTHLFGSGFPKSLDVSKAIDKAAGAKREKIGENPNHRGDSQMRNQYTKSLGQDGSITAPATDAAKQWQGWGTALKPASEHWILVRKPLSEKTVAANVLKWGTGALNIDASRVEAGSDLAELNRPNKRPGAGASGFMTSTDRAFTPSQGRFPANLVLDEEAAGLLDEQSGTLKSGDHKSTYFQKASNNRSMSGGNTARFQKDRPGDSGGASRFFYVAKASKSDKGKDNVHPTVKSTKLMSYLIELVTPPGGVVLDPFTGSGSTGVAAVSGGFKFVGIEQEAEYVEIAKKRIAGAQ